MVLTDNLPDILKLLVRLKVGPHAPDNISRAVIDNERCIQNADIGNDVVRVESLVSGIIPSVGAYPVDIVAVGHFHIVRPPEHRSAVIVHGPADGFHAELIPVIEQTP